MVGHMRETENGKQALEAFKRPPVCQLVWHYHQMSGTASHLLWGEDPDRTASEPEFREV